MNTLLATLALAATAAAYPMFLLEEDETGQPRVRTTVCCLDRETRAQYSLKLGVRDGGGRRGTATLNIRVMWS